MQFSRAGGNPLGLITIFICAAASSQASRLNHRDEVLVSSYSNATAVTSSTSTLSPTTNVSATITAAPTTYPWGNQSIVQNTCSSYNSTDNALIWTPCHVFAGTVQLSYFPSNKGNLTYPTTYYNSILDVTMTSPSIYLIVNTITGDNDCGPLGPTYATQVIPMDLTDVYTLQPYADSTVTTREGPPQILSLSDLETACPTTLTSISTTGQVVNTHPNDNVYNRCNPRLVYPVQLKRLGYPYWKHCGNNDYNFGLFDPPGAVPTADSLFATTAAVSFVSTTESASPAPTAASDQAASTSVVILQPTSTSTGISEVASSNPGQPTGAASNVTSSSLALGESSTQGETLVSPQTSSSVNVIVGTSGIYVAGSDSSSTYFANPTEPSQQTAVATIAGQTISAAPDASVIVINSQTIISGGQAVTISESDSVASLGSDGLVVEYAGGQVSTFPIATSSAAAGQVIGVAGTYSILASAGASEVVIGTQTVSLGGAVNTLENGDVVSLGSSGVVVQSPGGGLSTATILLVTKSTNSIASAVASIIGATSSTSRSATTTSASTAVFTGSANTKKSELRVGYLLLGFVLAVACAL